MDTLLSISFKVMLLLMGCEPHVEWQVSEGTFLALVSHGTLVRFKPHPIPLLGSEVNYSSHFPLKNIIRGEVKRFLRES